MALKAECRGEVIKILQLEASLCHYGALVKFPQVTFNLHFVKNFSHIADCFLTESLLHFDNMLQASQELQKNLVLMTTFIP